MHSLSVSKTFYVQCVVCSVETSQISKTTLQFRRGSLSMSQAKDCMLLQHNEKVSTKKCKTEQDQNATECRDYLLSLYKVEGELTTKSCSDSGAILKGHEIEQDDAIAQ